ncbi:MAG: hypothetical protein Q8K60_02060 [Parachlamydiaceae bacterium]|nr:hypothetical protein [Parachlamydiaceae bacterium]
MKKIFYTILILTIFFTPLLDAGLNGLLYLNPPVKNAVVNFDQEVAVVLFNETTNLPLTTGTEQVNQANLYSELALGYNAPGGILLPPSSDNYLVNYSISLNCVSAISDNTQTATLSAAIAYVQGKFGSPIKVGTQSATVKAGEVLNLSNQYLISRLDPNQPTFVYLILTPTYSDSFINFTLTSFSPCTTNCAENAPFTLGLESVSP